MTGNERKFIKRLDEKEKKSIQEMNKADKKLAEHVMGSKPKTRVVA